MRFVFFILLIGLLSGLTACYEEPTQDQLTQSLGEVEREVFAEYGCRCAHSAEEAKKKVNKIIKALLKEYEVPGGVDYTGPKCTTHDVKIVAGEPDPWGVEFYICEVTLEDGRKISYHGVMNWGSRPEWPPSLWSDEF